MASGQPSRRIQRARSEVSHRRTSMDSMKTEFRNRFLDKLRTSRSKSVDRLRKLVQNYESQTEYKSLNELRQVLLNEKEATDLISSDEVTDLLKEVEDELREVRLEYEAEKYVDDNQKETDDAIARLMNKCELCETLCIENVCTKCSAQLKSEFI